MEHHLTTPVREEDVRKLRMGDLVYVTGTVITARKERSPLSTSRGSGYSTVAPS